MTVGEYGRDIFRVLGGISWNVSGINSMRPKGNLPLLEEGQAAAGTHAPQSTRLGGRAEAPTDRPQYVPQMMAMSLHGESC